MKMDGRRASSVTSPHVSKKLCFAIVMFVGVICLSGGYVLGNVARNEARKHNDIISHNLTTTSDMLYRKARRLSPKAIHLHDPDKISARLLQIFHSECADCRMRNYNVYEYVKSIVNFEATNIIKALYNASQYIDTLR